jgi:hypothetical protein
MDSLQKPSNLKLEYVSPESVFGSMISKGKTDTIVPVVTNEADVKVVDFRFLRGDLIIDKSKLELVSMITEKLHLNNSNALGEVYLIIGTSGAGKTKSEFDIGQEQFIIYHDCPGMFFLWLSDLVRVSRCVFKGSD